MPLCHRIKSRGLGIKRRAWPAVLWLLAALLMPAFPALAGGKPIVLTTHNLAPYGAYQHDGRFDGIAVRVVSCALRAIGRELRISVLPWKRAQLEVQNGSADGFFAASLNSRRDSFAQASAVIAEQTWTWYFLKDSPLRTQDASFKTHALVSSFLGANMQRWIAQTGFRTTTFPPVDTETLLDMLLTGRLDAVLANNLVMDHILRRRQLKNAVRSEVQLNKPLSVYFSRAFLQENPGFLETFNAAVPDCRDTPQTSEILN